MLKIKAILIDDEYYALLRLKKELEELSYVEIVGMYEDGIEALEQIQANEPDIVFLDIEMPETSGIELFERISSISDNISIVFVTAYNEYAIKAFELNALDYLLKPVCKERLKNTLERIPKGNSGNAHTDIKMRCFRNFSISVNKMEINIGSRNRKAEELIAYLACEKGHYVSKEKIANELWPKLDGEKALANLYLSKYYLTKQQKTNGFKLPIDSVRGKMRFELDNIELDLCEFDSLLRLWKDSGFTDIVSAEKAISLYSGAVLEENYYTWTSLVQQSYEVEFSDLIYSVLKFHKSNNNTQKYTYYEQLNEQLSSSTL